MQDRPHGDVGSVRLLPAMNGLPAIAFPGSRLGAGSLASAAKVGARSHPVLRSLKTCTYWYSPRPAAVHPAPDLRARRASGRIEIGLPALVAR